MDWLTEDIADEFAAAQLVMGEHVDHARALCLIERPDLLGEWEVAPRYEPSEGEAALARRAAAALRDFRVPCDECGEARPLLSSTGCGRPRRYCSSQCRTAATRRRRGVDVGVAVRESRQTCVVCEVPITPSRSRSKPRLYCGAKCRKVAWQTRVSEEIRAIREASSDGGGR